MDLLHSNGRRTLRKCELDYETLLRADLATDPRLLPSCTAPPVFSAAAVTKYLSDIIGVHEAEVQRLQTIEDRVEEQVAEARDALPQLRAAERVAAEQLEERIRQLREEHCQKHERYYRAITTVETGGSDRAHVRSYKRRAVERLQALQELRAELDKTK